MQERFDAIKHFHNQKEPDIFYDPQVQADLRRELGDQDVFSEENFLSIKKKEKNGPGNKVESIHANEAIVYDDVIGLVKEASLKAEYAQDELEKKILENRKHVILGVLKHILEDISKYVSVINYMGIQKESDSNDGRSFREQSSLSDSERRRYHNRLISDINVAIKNININFNADFPEEMRIQGEARYADRKGWSEEEIREAVSKRELVRFPKGLGVFIDVSRFSKDPDVGRRYVAEWAFRIYAELSKLELDLDKKRED